MSNAVRRVGGFSQQFANSFESAVRLLRGLTGPAMRPGGLRSKVATKAIPGAAKERLQTLNVAHRQLLQDMEKLEQELEQLHGAITAGGRAPTGAVDRGRGLNAAMVTARQLRERIQEKRLELSRLERTIARERQLLGQAEAQPAAQAPSKVAPATPAQAKSPRVLLLQGAVAKALRDAPLADRAERALVASIAEGLMSDDDEVRRQAVTRIGERAQPVVSLLVLAARDADERVRLAALGALTGQRHPAVTKIFRDFLRDPSPVLRLAALRGLASAGERVLTNGDLVGALADGDAAVRRAAADVLGWHGEDAQMSWEVIRALVFALYDEDDAVRLAAVEALGTAGDDRAVLALMNAVGDASEAVRGAALRALRSLVGVELDAVVDGTPPESRVATLKTWWRGARVQLRSGPTISVEPGRTARDVLQALAAIKEAGATQKANVSPPAELPKPADVPKVAVEAPRAPIIRPAEVPASASASAAAGLEGVAPSVGKVHPGAAESLPEKESSTIKGLPAVAEFESVLGEGAEQDDNEEYETILEDKGS